MCYHYSITMRRVSNVAPPTCIATRPFYRLARMTEHGRTSPPPPIARYLPISIGPPTYTHYHHPTPSLDRHLGGDGRARYQNTELIGRGEVRVRGRAFYFSQTSQNICIQPMPFYSDQRYTWTPTQCQSTGYTIPSILLDGEPLDTIEENSDTLRVLDEAFGNRDVDDDRLHEMTAVFWDIAAMAELNDM